MKKIYTFTLENEDYPSGKVSNDLRLFAYLMYDLLYNYDGDGFTPLNINKNVVRNNIYDGSRCGEYYLDSDIYDDGYINYEPFLIGKSSFGLTIVDDSMNEKILNDLINQVLFMTGFDYDVTIRSTCYDSKNNDDESQRRKAMYLVYNNIGCNVPPKKFGLGFSRKRIMNHACITNSMRVMGR